MTGTSFVSSVGVMLALSLTISPAQERRVERSALPAPVARTMEREIGGATVKGFSTEREGGKKVYEAETVVDGHTRDLQVAEDGTLNEIEEEIAFRSLPEPVQKGLMAKAGAAKITKVESLTKGGRLVAYEAATLRDGKKGEIQVGPTGNVLKHAE